MQQGKWNEIDSLGGRLNKLLDCPVRFPGMGGYYMLCGHGMSISITKLLENDDWTWVKEKHDQWLKTSRR